MPLAPGVNVDRYTLVEHLGGGGQADVWRADDPLHPDEPRAIKLVSTRLAKSAALERVRREARLLAGLHHPSLCRIHGLFEDLDQEVLGLVMDYVPGISLAAALEDERLDQPARIHVLLHLARALAHVHAAGAVHRDVKLDNIVLSKTFFVRPEDPKTLKLVDFGVASTDDGATTLTSEGHVVGTASAMAPEQLEPHHYGVTRPGPPADVFAIGVVAWQLLIGGHPTRLPPTATIGDFIAAYRTAESSGDWPPKAPSRSPLMRVVRRCLALHPEDRYAHAGMMLARVTEALAEPEPEKKGTPVHGEPQQAPVTVARPRRQSRSLAPVVVGLLVLTVVGFIAAFSRTTDSALSATTAEVPMPLVLPPPRTASMPSDCKLSAPLCDCCMTRQHCRGDCRAPLRDNDHFRLRLHSASQVFKGDLKRMPLADVRVAVANGRLRKVTSFEGIPVTGTDLNTRGLDITVYRGKTLIARWKAVRHDAGYTREDICKGITFNFHFTDGPKPELPDKSVSGLVAFYLDPDDDRVPPRCNDFRPFR